jgi:hypothetical protein
MRDKGEVTKYNFSKISKVALPEPQEAQDPGRNSASKCMNVGTIDSIAGAGGTIYTLQGLTAPPYILQIEIQI